NILLGLSGGGFRATLFHLGVLRAFRCHRLLGSIRAISSVSGGSITSAHLVSNWHEYSNYDVDHFDRLETELFKFVSRGIRERIILRWPAALCIRRTSTDLLLGEYRRLFGTDKKLAGLHSDKNVPRLFLMTTNLSRHTAHSYFSHNGYTLDRATIPIVTMGLAEAVTASSAFPMIFPAFVLDYAKVGVSTSGAGVTRDYLTDGGVFENLGLTVLREHASSLQLVPPDQATIVLSNAGKTIDWDLETNFARRLFGNLNRAIDVMQYWAEKRFLSSLSEGEHEISIAESIPPHPGSANMPPEIVQKAISYLRTDLDMFSMLHCRMLYDHGFTLASSLIDKMGWSTVEKHANPYQPWSDDTLRQCQHPRTIHLLRAPVRIFPRLQALWDVAIVPYVLAILICVCGIWALTPRISQAISAAIRWIDEQQFESHTSEDIRFNRPMVSTTLRDRLDFVTTGMSREAKAAIDACRRRQISEFPGNVVVIVEQETPFSADYQSMHRWLRFSGSGGSGNVRAMHGAAFVLDTNGNHEGPRYREVRMAQKVNGELQGCVDVFQPRENESIVMVVVAAAIIEKEPITVMDVEQSTFTLGVSQ
ncbi:MAG TPA: patatin-like phospholipase family protein, partial [Pirellulaceae bacterium]|nr:patatin-like phospholipase family protein [Pirellulaceae bacterium]